MKKSDKPKKEYEILQLIKSNPYLTQQEMADQLQISRPALANLISSLIKTGTIKGRAYILEEQKPIYCIGGANVDRKFRLHEKEMLHTSNPSTVQESVGGVVRNVAENLGRLGNSVHLLTTAAKDSDWQLIEEASKRYMELRNVQFFSNQSTGSYSAVLNPNGELVIAMANMAIYDHLSIDYLSAYETQFAHSSLVVADLNCPKETISYLVEFAETNMVQLAIIPVSSPKMNRLPDNLNGVAWLICNRDEAETYLQMNLNTQEDFYRAIDQFISRGVKNVIITSGADGVYGGGGTSNKNFHHPAIVIDDIVDVTGAGDAFVSAVLHRWLQGDTLYECVRAGTVNAAKTLQSPLTVRSNLTESQLQIELEEYK